MGILLLFIILIALVVVHEYGHFIVAKLAGVKVPEFGVGFPPKLFGIKRGETEYTINALPLGGFVRIFGEQEADIVSEADRPRAFLSKPWYIKAAILVAGVAMNVLVAWVLIAGSYVIGAPTSTPEGRLFVTSIAPNSPAEKAGVKAGDEIIATQLQDTIFQFTTTQDFVGEVGKHDLVILTLRKSNEDRTLAIAPEAGVIQGSPEKKALGIGIDTLVVKTLPIHEALWQSVIDVGGGLVAIVGAVGGIVGSLVSLSPDVSQVSGPLGILSYIDRISVFGWGALLSFAAIISLNLAVFNLLPFPALDGGRLLVVLAEAATRRTFNEKIVGWVHTIGFVLLIALFVAVTVQDVTRLGW